MEHDSYDDAYLRGILRDVKVIAMVGASPNWNRPSYFAMKYLQDKGFRVIPVNPQAAGETILGERCYADLADVPGPIDMVDIFRRSDAVGPIVDAAIRKCSEGGVVSVEIDDLQRRHGAFQFFVDARRTHQRELADGKLGDVFDAAILAHQDHVRRIEIGVAERYILGAVLRARHADGDEIDAVLIERRDAIGVDDRNFLRCDAEPLGHLRRKVDVVADDALAGLEKAARRRTLGDANE